MAKLDKLSMPKKGKPMDDAAVLELEMEPASEDEGEDEGETGEEPAADEHMGEHDLSEVSDEDLMAELKKRGLSSDLGKGRTESEARANSHGDDDANQ